MQFKIDENLHIDAVDLLRKHGHDAMTVFDQGLRGHADGQIGDVCQDEARAILTFDLVFNACNVGALTYPNAVRY